MSKDPAFLFYSNDFLSGTFTMTNEQVGKYIRLLCLQHQKGIISDKDMKNICGTYDEEIYSKFSKGDKGYYNERLKLEAEKRSAYSQSRRTNRSKKNITKTYVPHMENENVNEDVNEIEKHIVDIFCSNELCKMWKQWTEYKHTQFKFNYKNLQSELVAINNLHKLSNGKTDIATAIINQSISNGWKGLFEVKQQQQPTNEARYQARVDYANRHNS